MLKIITDSNNVLQTIEGAQKIFNFGTVKKHTDTSFKLKVQGEGLKEVNVKTYCGCTSGTPKKIDDNTFEVLITYKNSHIVKPFSKVINLNIKQDNKEFSETIKIKGIIK